MIYANAGKARIGGRDINVPCDPLKLPAEGGRESGKLREPFAVDINVPCDPLKLI